MYKELLNHQLVFISGKGGVGKTTLATALALCADEMKKQVLLVETSLCEQIAPLLGYPPVGHCETRVSPYLSLISIDPRLCFKEYVAQHLGMEKLYEKVFGQPIVKSFIEAVPGLSEIMLLGRLFHTCELERGRYDVVIYDAPASGHFLGLMTSPEAVIEANLLGPLLDEVLRVKAFLQDPKKCKILLVTLPEPLVMAETLDFLPKLKARALAALAGVCVNRSLDGALVRNDKMPKETREFLLHKIEQANNQEQGLREYLHGHSSFDARGPLDVARGDGEGKPFDGIIFYPSIPDFGFFPEPWPESLQTKLKQVMIR